MKTNLTPMDPDPQVPRLDGNGCYAEGDRVIALDAVGNVERMGTVGAIYHDGNKTYLVIRHGDEPFTEGFLCTREDIVRDLPDDNIEAIEEWLEGSD